LKLAPDQHDSQHYLKRFSLDTHLTTKRRRSCCTFFEEEVLMRPLVCGQNTTHFSLFDAQIPNEYAICSVGNPLMTRPTPIPDFDEIEFATRSYPS
jgi:hypothetical protein